MVHQYIERESGKVCTEQLYGDRLIKLVYNQVRENAPLFFKLCTSARMSSLLGFVNFDAPLSLALPGAQRFVAECGVDLSECMEKPEYFTTPRRIFERQIRYWECRPMTKQQDAVVSPADSRVLLGSLKENSQLFIKEKFFEFEELLGLDRKEWLKAFRGGDFAVFRLTPDKYHYNHVPVSGRVVDFYEISGAYHSCNPGAVVEIVTPYSKNKRVVTIIDTDVSGGSCVGLVAMVEVVALMIGEVVQCYSAERYDNPVAMQPGMFIQKGAPKSLFRPGSSTDVLIFQEDRISFARDLLCNRNAPSVSSRFTAGFATPLIETDVKVRSIIATANHL